MRAGRAVRVRAVGRNGPGRVDRAVGRAGRVVSWCRVRLWAFVARAVGLDRACALRAGPCVRNISKEWWVDAKNRILLRSTK